ncbi:RNA-protein complex protein Nop10 [Methanobacterium petrolearium]|uniref:RNA-protein complex protein Nop10 n=1 Tax=Methanobacterium petrolearium TaxID=710190 RepID=UPI001AE709B9|nr:RNA-protein complex protein Nop10 [Methanobacterium petrolearium]MBP1944696.1 H/ACA ribonucleoprotein complex subunit 3 [Methanobacterium petrolearium]
MKLKMRRCRSCKEYTLKDRCPHCGGELEVIYPPKYSPEDKYGKYRRILKKQAIEKNQIT